MLVLANILTTAQEELPTSLYEPLAQAELPEYEIVLNELKAKAYYCTLRGTFIYHTTTRFDTRRKPGDEVGNAGRGYYTVMLNKNRYMLHRLIWLWFTGHYPNDKEEIDHVDRNPSNNKIENLRLVTHKINTRNATRRSDNWTGAVGVSYHKKTGKWRARVTVDNKEIHLGMFEFLAEAEQARKDFLEDHPEFNFTLTHGEL